MKPVRFLEEAQDELLEEPHPLELQSPILERCDPVEPAAAAGQIDFTHRS